MIKSAFLAVFILFAQLLVAQTDFKGWHLKDKAVDNFNGISLDKAYEYLKAKKSKPVIVAVIDSGIDTAHEDLRPVLWHNPKEIPGNGKDDDRNGYVDDVYGWNFLGGKDGRNVTKDALEASRIYFRYRQQFGGLTDTVFNNSEDRRLYTDWKRAAAEVEQSVKPKAELDRLEQFAKNLTAADSLLRSVFKKECYTGNELQTFEASDEQTKKAKEFIVGVMQRNSAMESKSIEFIQRINTWINDELAKAKIISIPPPQYRNEVTGDDETNINDRSYGNNDLMSTIAFHGTHVSGIIAAVRKNGKGIDGIGDNVRILTVRAVPDGDEHDKDVALAIRYAVDNGARIINMSFGKAFSPEKKWVDEAVAYAAKKGVLLVHAAGNDGNNIDTAYNFPTPVFSSNNTRAANWINVGASSDMHLGSAVASFSNWGKTEVDLFAPGVSIYSSVPGGNKYDNANGTSMAAPVVSGVAALLLSYYPTLTATELKYILETSAQPMEATVNRPGGKETIDAKELSRTGGIVNAFAAVQLAEKIIAGKKAKTVAKK